MHAKKKKKSHLLQCSYKQWRSTLKLLASSILFSHWIYDTAPRIHIRLEIPCSFESWEGRGRVGYKNGKNFHCLDGETCLFLSHWIVRFDQFFLACLRKFYWLWFDIVKIIYLIHVKSYSQQRIVSGST